MGVASGIFWIMIGVLYILYQAFKEHPSETLTGSMLFLSIIIPMLAFGFTLNWLLSINLIAGTVFLAVGLGVLAVFMIKTYKEELEKKERATEFRERVMKVVRKESYTDDELKDYARRWAYKAKDGWMYRTHKFEEIKPKLIEDYRKNVRYYIVASELREQDKVSQSKQQ